MTLFKNSMNIDQAKQFAENKHLELNLIIAQTEGGIIGTGKKIPWHISEDLQFFKKTTMNSNLIMGNNTLKSIGRALPGRKNIVLSRESSTSAIVENIFFANTPLKALQFCDPASPVFIIGGAQIYDLFENLISKAFITIVDLEVKNATIKYNALQVVVQKKWKVIEEKELNDISKVFVYAP